jgi:ABC-2 type transport system permease protein/lipopolysaccharide transport system permease protein
MIVFSVFVRRVVRVNTGGVPYPLFSYLGVLPWTFFSSAVSSGGQVLLLNKHLLNKVACPREVFPLAMVVTATFDTALAVLALGLLFAISGFAPKATSYWIPLLLAVQFAFTIGVTLIVSSAVVYLRDVVQGLPLVLQLGLFATPVAYGIELVPRHLQTTYAAINPLAGVIQGYRRTILNGQPPDWHLLIPGAISSAFLLVFGYVFFKRLEAGFADVA